MIPSITHKDGEFYICFYKHDQNVWFGKVKSDVRSDDANMEKEFDEMLCKQKLKYMLGKYKLMRARLLDTNILNVIYKVSDSSIDELKTSISIFLS